MDLAISGFSKAFVAHEHCQELIDRRWRGDFDRSTCALPAPSYASPESKRTVVELAITRTPPSGDRAEAHGGGAIHHLS